MMKEDDFMHEPMSDGMDPMEVVADEVTIGPGRYQSVGNSMETLKNTIMMKSGRVILTPGSQTGPSSPLKVIRLATSTGSMDQNIRGNNKQIRIITIPRSSNQIGGNPVAGIRSVEGTVLRMATPQGKLIHFKTGASPVSAGKGAIFVTKLGQGEGNQQIITTGPRTGNVLRATPSLIRRPDGSYPVGGRQFILAQKPTSWNFSQSMVKQEVEEMSPHQHQQIMSGGTRLLSGSSSLARALALTPGAVIGGRQEGAPTLDPNSDGADSGDESNVGYTTTMKSNGLRKYAQSVCQKVQEKGITSYNEVADELVQEYAAENPMIPQDQLQYHQKNIRRRVYDALNVLMAMQIIHKEKKEIRWVGLPVNAMQEKKRLEVERDRKMGNFKTKLVNIEELIKQLICYKTLISRNRCREKSCGPPPANSLVYLPFLTVPTRRKTVINCNISEDKLDYLLTFDQSFEMHDHMDTLRSMGLNLDLGNDMCSETEYQQCLDLVPPALRFYVEAMYERRPAIEPDLEAVHEQRRHYMDAKLAAAASGGYIPPSSTRVTLTGVSSGIGSYRLTPNTHQSTYGHRSLLDHHHDNDDDDLDDLDVDDDMDSEEDRSPRSDEAEELDVG